MRRLPKIELIVHTVSSATSPNHRCTFTFTVTGESLLVETLGENGDGLPHLLFDCYGPTYCVNETVPILEYGRRPPFDCAESKALPKLRAMLKRARKGAS